MNQVIYNQITDNSYLGVVTILDYDASVRKCLSDILVCTQNRTERSVIVDLALKVGVNKYRFISCDITDDGKVLWNSSKYVTPCKNIVQFANSILKQQHNILPNSMLPVSTQVVLLNS